VPQATLHREKRLRHLEPDYIREKIGNGQALNLKELAVATGFSYDAVRPVESYLVERQNLLRGFCSVAAQPI
jgi:hypothetical protein